MAIYFASSNLDVAISRDKKKVRRFAKQTFRFAASDLQIGVMNLQILGSSSAYKEEFGDSILYDLDQKIVFRPDFSVARTM